MELIGERGGGNPDFGKTKYGNGRNYTAGKERACEQNLGNVFCPHAVK
jgi:hypothetical protein